MLVNLIENKPNPKGEGKLNPRGGGGKSTPLPHEINFVILPFKKN